MGSGYRPGSESDDFEAGTHEVRVGGAIRNPPEERGPLPPGPYDLEVIAGAQDAGNQERQRTGPVKLRVEIRPARG